MTDARKDWICSADDGSARAEVSILPGELVVCLWRCEEKLATIQRELENMGLKVEMEWQGPCIHEEAGHADKD